MARRAGVVGERGKSKADEVIGGGGGGGAGLGRARAGLGKKRVRRVRIQQALTFMQFGSLSAPLQKLSGHCRRTLLCRVNPQQQP